MRIILINAIILFVLTALQAQLPSTNIHQFKFVETGQGLSVLSPKYLSGFNESGYNNQPSFLKSDKLLITSNSEDEKYTDIIILDLARSNYRFFTKTDKISEFSPTLMPSKSQISVIRQEGEDQFLWAYPLDGSDSGYDLLGINDVGYHVWLDDENLALFRVTDPVSLSIANIKTQKVITKLNNIGRCLKVNNKGQLLFVQKVNEDFWYLKNYDIETDKIKTISEIDVEDFEILPSGTFIKAKGSLLYKLGERDENWKQVEDLAPYGIKNITRLACFRNKLIVVSND